LPRKGMGAKRVLELGPGPKDGCLHHERLASAFVRVGIDPYYPEYEAAGWCPDADGVLRLPGTADQIPGSAHEGKYDIVVACNALDHHPEDHGSVAANCAGAVAAVAPGGRLYVWMHTREPEDLDLGHDTPATEWDLLRPMLHAGDWRVWRCTALRSDPVNGGPWRTIVLIGERATTWVP
jgi:SAM-dependent methyltransferase